MRALFADEEGALEAIVDAPQAWVSAAYLERRGYDGATIESLIAMRVVERWRKPSNGTLPAELLTLTPWGAAWRKVEVEERGGQVRWVESKLDGDGQPILSSRPVYGAGGKRVPYPELIADPRPGPEYLLDGETGERILLFRFFPVEVKRDRRRKLRPRRRD